LLEADLVTPDRYHRRAELCELHGRLGADPGACSGNDDYPSTHRSELYPCFAIIGRSS
jgi:hypothetical protein